MQNDDSDISDFPFRVTFKRDDQIRLCAQQLEGLKAERREAWHELGNEKLDLDSGLQELKHLVKYLIHHASDSRDYTATVDFITKRAAQKIRGLRKKPGTLPKGLLSNWAVISYEHMVPDDVILKLITERPPHCRAENIEGTLAQLSYRALVAGTKRKNSALPECENEVRQLDKSYRSSMPKDLVTVLGANAPTLSEVRLAYFPLVRYEAAGLRKELIPVTARAKQLLRRYEAWRAGLQAALPTPHTRAMAPA